VDIAHSEMVEKELDYLITRRSKQKDPEEHSELWRESVRRYNARKCEEVRAAWCEYHQGQAARHRAILASLVAYHEEQAEKYLPRGDVA
jgi:hypothetical protein